MLSKSLRSVCSYHPRIFSPRCYPAGGNSMPLRCQSTSSDRRLTLQSLPVQQYLTHLRAEFSILNGGQTDSPDAERRFRFLSHLLGLEQRHAECFHLLDELHNFSEGCSQDMELAKMAELDKAKCTADAEMLEQQIISGLLPPLPEDSSNELILEVIPGVGGEEAMLFARDIFQLYQRYAAFKGWRFEVKSVDDDTQYKGIRKAVANVSGNCAYQRLKFEAGVHRVQRIPATEYRGRMHTSAAAVAILPQPRNPEVLFSPQDIEITMTHSSGHGGQNVNTSLTQAVVKHFPTGLVVRDQSERSAQANRANALKRLAGLLFQKQLEVEQEKSSSTRKLQTASRDRSDKIRTLNFQADRITEHRIGKQLSNVEAFLSGTELFDGLVDALLEYDYEERLLKEVEKLEMNASQEKLRTSAKTK